jgi:hypothetical protein
MKENSLSLLRTKSLELASNAPTASQPSYFVSSLYRSDESPPLSLISFSSLQGQEENHFGLSALQDPSQSVGSLLQSVVRLSLLS